METPNRSGSSREGPSFLRYAARRAPGGALTDRDEVILLHLARIAAERMARSGEVTEGLCCLLAAVQRAEAARDRRAPGAEELLLRSRLAVRDYCRAHGLVE